MHVCAILHVCIACAMLMCVGPCYCMWEHGRSHEAYLRHAMVQGT